MFEAAIRFFASAFGRQAGEAKSFHPSQTCPECGSRLCASELWSEHPREPESSPQIPESSPGVSPHQAGDWRCPNPDCPAQIRANLRHWCSPDVMDIAGGEVELIAKIVGRGLARDVSELYRLKVKEIAALPGMDKESAQRFFDALTGSLQREAWRLLFGLGIPEVSAADAEVLCRHFGSVDNVFAASVERLIAAGNVSETAARSLVKWHSDPVNRRLLKRLFKMGLNFKA